MPEELMITLGIVGGIIGLLVGLLALCFVLLFTVPASATVSYHTEFGLTVRVFGIPFRIFPCKKKKRYNPRHYTLKKIRRREEQEELRRKKRAEAKANKKSQKKKSPPKEGKKTTGEKQDFSELTEWIPVIGRVAKLFFSRFFKKLRIRVMKLHIRVTAEDAATTAMAYVAVRQSVELLMAGLAKFCHLHDLRKADLDIVPDYTADKFDVDVCVNFKMSLGNVVVAVLRAGTLLLTEWIKIQSASGSDSKPPMLPRILGVPIPPAPPRPTPPVAPVVPVPPAPPVPNAPYAPSVPDIPVPDAPPCPAEPVFPVAPVPPDIPQPPDVPGPPDVPAPETPPSPFGSA